MNVPSVQRPSGYGMGVVLPTGASDSRYEVVKCRQKQSMPSQMPHDFRLGQGSPVYNLISGGGNLITMCRVRSLSPTRFKRVTIPLHYIYVLGGTK